MKLAPFMFEAVAMAVTKTNDAVDNQEREVDRPIPGGGGAPFAVTSGSQMVFFIY